MDLPSFAGAMKVLFVFGTRPEAIKLAPVVRELSAGANFHCKTCVTGQHRELLTQVLDLFGLRPDWNLDIMRPDQDLAYLTGAALSGVAGILSSYRPDRVIVQGDTTTTFAGALAAFYHRVPVAHIEAGLRTGNIYAPWPEEVNRRLVSQVADLHFAPTGRARDNLLREGVNCDRIVVTGNTGIDALLWVAIVFPVHPNPNVRRATAPLHRHDNILLIDPVDYPELVFLLKRCHFVVTDSGGIQEEAPSFGKPVLVTRDATERPEAMEHGLAKLVGTDDRRLFDEMQRLLDDPQAYRRMSRVENPYGDGFASRRIAAQLIADQTGGVPPVRPFAAASLTGG